jgi:hypothetical protein
MLLNKNRGDSDECPVHIKTAISLYPYMAKQAENGIVLRDLRFFISFYFQAI